MHVSVNRYISAPLTLCTTSLARSEDTMPQTLSKVVLTCVRADVFELLTHPPG